MDHLISPEDPMGLFELKEELAEGSFGVVYKGKKKKNQKKKKVVWGAARAER